MQCKDCKSVHLLLLLLELLRDSSKHAAHSAPHEPAHEALRQPCTPLLPFPALSMSSDVLACMSSNTTFPR